MADPIGTFSGLASGIQWREMVDQMMQMEISRRFTPVQNQVNAAQRRRDAWNSFSGLLSKFSASAQAIGDGGAFGALQTSLSNGPAGKTLLTATASSSATPGSYQVKVVELARAEKLSGGAFATTSEPLNLTGEFFVNGRRVEVKETDTLTSVRNAINAANTGSNPSGVSATILSTSPDEHRLVLTSAATGTRGIELSDGGTGVLQSLGMTTGTLVQNSAPGDPSSVQTQRFTSESTSLASMLGLSAPPAVTSIQIDGQSVTVDLQNDTLLSLMKRIEQQEIAASLGVEKVGSKDMHRLTVAGPVAADPTAIDPAVSQRVIELLGFQTGERAAPITEGRNALVEIDGFQMTRRSNVVSDAISGVTLNLQAEDAGTVDVAITRDTGAVVKAAESMAAAYNELVKFANDQRSSNGPLASNSSLRSMLNSVKGTLLGGVGALSSDNPYTHASFTGIELTKEGTLKVDTAKLKSALETNFEDVKALLTTAGTVTDGQVSYIAAGKKAQPGAYAIEITAAATMGTQLGSVWADSAAYAASDGISDTLTLTDSFTSKSVDFTIAHGTSLDDAALELNTLLSSQGLRLSATVEGGALRISATEYGSRAGFTVAGTAAAQLGLTEGATAGEDVAGTIGGLAATGSGRTLTGVAGGATDGIAIRYTGSTARSAGEVRFVLGVGGLLERAVEPTIRTNDGIIATQVTSIDRSIETLNKRLDDIESRLEVRRQSLIGQFTRMEGALSLLQSQSTWLASQVQSLPKYNSE